VAVSPNHFWITSSEWVWASSLSEMQASETTIVRYPRSHAPRGGFDGDVGGYATSTSVSTPATRKTVSRMMRSIVRACHAHHAIAAPGKAMC
jgi:hypothetical protein